MGPELDRRSQGRWVPGRDLRRHRSRADEGPAGHAGWRERVLEVGVDLWRTGGGAGIRPATAHPAGHTLLQHQDRQQLRAYRQQRSAVDRGSVPEDGEQGDRIRRIRPSHAGPAARHTHRRYRSGERQEVRDPAGHRPGRRARHRGERRGDERDGDRPDRKGLRERLPHRPVRADGVEPESRARPDRPEPRDGATWHQWPRHHRRRRGRNRPGDRGRRGLLPVGRRF